MSEDKNSGLFIGFLFGAAVGVAIGMLYAPRPGKETRAMLREKMEAVEERAASAAEQAKEAALKLERKAMEKVEKFRKPADPATTE